MLNKAEEKILNKINEYFKKNPIFPTTPIIQIKIPEFKEIFVKDESINPTGTHKDRISIGIIKQYQHFLISKKKGIIDKKLPAFSIISTGNAGVSLAHYLEKFQLPKPKVLIDINSSEKIKSYLKNSYCEIYETDLSKKELSTEEILELTKNKEGFDITSNKTIDKNMNFYEVINHDLLHENADYILVPFGSGLLYESICETMKQKNKLKQEMKKANVIGATTNNKKSKADHLYSPHLPFTNYNKKWLSFYKKFGYIGKESGVFVIEEKYIEEAYELLNSQGINCEHSGAAGLAYLLQNKENLPKDKKYLIINTGKGIWR